MTELNQEPNTEPSVEPEPLPHEALEYPSGPEAPPKAAEKATPQAADVDWPALQGQVQDPAVSAVLDRLAAVRLTPVSGHGEVYAGMHDALLEALNEDVASHAGLARRIHAAGDGGA